MGSVAFTIALAVAVTGINGRHIHHQEPTKRQKGLSESQLILNATRLGGGSQQQQNHIVNWTRIEQDETIQRKAKELATKWLGAQHPNAAIFEREIIRKVFSRPITAPKPNATPDPSEGVPFAFSNIEVNNNWTAFDTSKIQTDNLLRDKNSTITCPPDKPFYDGEHCTACNDGGYFDIDTKRCGWPTPSMEFDPNLHRFVRPQARMKTRSNAPYVQYNGIAKSEYERLRKQQSDSPDEQCPIDAPYYDRVVCVQCTMPFPVFNVQSLRCERCQTENLYSQEHHGCYLPSGARAPLSIRQSLGRIIG